MAPKIFYSWQSDLSGKVNHYFIRDALDEAIAALGADLGVDESDRPELDHDRKNVPGTPDLFATILKKIDACAVFVADVSLTGTTDGGNKRIPNANVGIELGYAFRAAGNEKVLLVMNTSYGAPSELPFDLRHKSFPIQYSLGVEDNESKAVVRKKLVRDLHEAIREILKHIDPPNAAPVDIHNATSSSYNSAVYFGESEALVERIWPNGTFRFVANSGPLYFLRLIPKSVLPKLTSLRAYELMMEDPALVPFGRPNGWNNDRNRYGAIAFDNAKSDETTVRLRCFSQLFLNGELWGVDCEALSNSGFPKQDAASPRFVPTTYIETVGVTGLGNFLHVARERLNYLTPVRMIIGLVKINGFTMTVGGNRVDGKLLQDDLIYESTLTDLRADPRQILNPFFDELWEQSGLKRPIKIG